MVSESVRSFVFILERVSMLCRWHKLNGGRTNYRTRSWHTQTHARTATVAEGVGSADDAVDVIDEEVAVLVGARLVKLLEALLAGIFSCS